MMTLPRSEWMWQLTHKRTESPRGTLCDDRMLAAGICESYLYLIHECTKEEAWRRIKILRAALETTGGR
jgi:phosphopantothenate synthetase